jgi:hypothetical protein
LAGVAGQAGGAGMGAAFGRKRKQTAYQYETKLGNSGVERFEITKKVCFAPKSEWPYISKRWSKCFPLFPTTFPTA